MFSVSGLQQEHTCFGIHIWHGSTRKSQRNFWIIQDHLSRTALHGGSITLPTDMWSLSSVEWPPMVFILLHQRFHRYLTYSRRFLIRLGPYLRWRTTIQKIRVDFLQIHTGHITAWWRLYAQLLLCQIRYWPSSCMLMTFMLHGDMFHFLGVLYVLIYIFLVLYICCYL